MRFAGFSGGERKRTPVLNVYFRHQNPKTIRSNAGLPRISSREVRNKNVRNEMLQMAILQPKLAILDEKLGGSEHGNIGCHTDAESSED